MIFQKVKQEHGKINVIPNNYERNLSFDVGRLKFLDSMQFLSLLSKKGIYCYDYMDSMERFDETSLPSVSIIH